MKRILFLVISICSLSIAAYAQPDLPNMATLSQGGINVLSWINPYTTGVKSVSIERSAESGINFLPIGSISDLKKPTQFFTDPSPMPGDNYYRVKIVFSSDLEWLSNESLMNVDSSLVQHRRTMPSQDSINAMITQLGVNAPPEVMKPTFPISQYVYTNPYNGNINIELQNPLEISYRIEFYDDAGNKVLQIPRVNDELVVLDKRNFQKYGQYQFKIFKGNEEFSKGYVSVY